MPFICRVQYAGVNFMEKTIGLRQTDITFSIWDLGGTRCDFPVCAISAADRI